MKKKYVIITNNPLVKEKIQEEDLVVFRDISYEEVLRLVRDKMHEGYELLSHPLSGSVKPNETPYKSVMISREKGCVEQSSLTIIENAIQACGKFAFRSDKYRPEVYEDFRLIDWSLIESAMSSADTL